MSYELATGKLKDMRGSHNQNIVKGFCSLINALITEGPQAASRWGHLWREKSLMFRKLEPTTSKRLHIASTVVRSIGWEYSADQRAEKEEIAVQAWMSDPHMVREDLYEGLQEYISQLPRMKVKEPLAPLLSDKSCLTHNTRAGGCAASIAERYEAHLEERTQDWLSMMFEAPPWAAIAAGGEYNITEQTLEGPNQLGAWRSEPSTQGAKVDEYARKLFSQLPAYADIRPLALQELGKLRAISLHPAEEVIEGKRVTAVYLRNLRCFYTIHDILSGQEIAIFNKAAGAKILSADLTAATDHIDHELAQRTARMFNEHIGHPELNSSTDFLFGPKRLADGRVTRRGIHMGLGAGWTILCLLNGFAAWNTGANKESHAICGDDLAGAFTPHQRQIYLKTIEDLGLKINHKKSFYGPRGVFCEKLILPVSPGLWKSEELAHLSEVSGAKCEQDRERNRFEMLKHLEGKKDKFVDRLIRQTQDRLVPGLPPGPTALGLSGKAGANMSLELAKIVAKGLPRLTTSGERSEFMDHVSVSSESAPGSYPMPVMTQALEEIRQRDAYLRGERFRKPQTLAAKVLLQRAIANSKVTGKIKATTLQSLLDCKPFMSLSKKAQKVVLYLVRGRTRDGKICQFPERLSYKIQRILCNKGAVPFAVIEDDYYSADRRAQLKQTLARCAQRYGESNRRGKNPTHT